MNTTVENLRHLCVSAGDMEARDLIDGVCKRGDGGNNNPGGVNQYTREVEREQVTVDIVNSDLPEPTPPEPAPEPEKDVRTRPTGNSTDRALRKLRTEAESNPAVAELREEVLAGEDSAWPPLNDPAGGTVVWLSDRSRYS